MRQAERRLKRRHRQVSRKYDSKRKKAKQPQSQNDCQARQKLAKAHLQMHRQCEDVARTAASTVVSSHDLITHEDLQIRHLARNHRLAKSLHDAAWGRFLVWLGYDARLHGVPVIAVPPQYTTQACSGCGTLGQKTLSTRTPVCWHCGLVLDRDENAARTILVLALLLWEQIQTSSHGSRYLNRTAGQAGTGSG